MRFDSGALGQWSEICAYGTGVWVKPVTDVINPAIAATMEDVGAHDPAPTQAADVHSDAESK